MGLYPQPNNWQCGPFALKHALIMLGIVGEENRISRIAGANWWEGADEIQLGRAARAYNCRLKLIRQENPLRARRELLLALKRGFPCLLCIEQWNHWIVVIGAEKGKLIYVDSRKHPVVCVATWAQLKRRWRYVERDEKTRKVLETMYDLHPLTPGFRVRSKARFSLKRARYLRRPENRLLASRWNEYFDDLSAICKPRNPRSSKVFPVGELLRRHGSMIKSEIDFWHGSVQRRKLERVVKNIWFVAETYDFVIHSEHEKRAIAAITANLSLWAAATFGVEKRSQ